MSSQPNVLLICTDHWPARLMGEAGHPVARTPTLDTLARNGVRFTNAYSECPVCIPARRTLMTGMSTRAHGDREFKVLEPMPAFPTLAQTFRDNGYQAQAVGKLHVYPQRDRIGFDDVMLVEEGRPILGAVDDYDLWLADQGQAGLGYAHGMSNNEYTFRPWHLPESHHTTNWITRTMCRQIKRRDPTRPAFWYLSYVHPHPPLVPLQAYLDLYRDLDMDDACTGDWSGDPDSLPYLLRVIRSKWQHMPPGEIARIRRAFYALCTHIDHQMRLVIGTLREERLLDNTIIMFTSDHGDMLGDHGLWAKRVYYEASANVPMLVQGTREQAAATAGTVSDRLVGWQDIMPTLLDMAGLEIPDHVEGRSMFGSECRSHLYGECGEGPKSSRMIRQGSLKLIYYPWGHRRQLFDVDADPAEQRDLASLPAHADDLERLTKLLVAELYGPDLDWMVDGELVGMPEPDFAVAPNRDLSGQRGIHWPVPPRDASGDRIGMP